MSHPLIAHSLMTVLALSTFFVYLFKLSGQIFIILYQYIFENKKYYVIKNVNEIFIGFIAFIYFINFFNIFLNIKISIFLYFIIIILSYMKIKYTNYKFVKEKKYQTKYQKILITIVVFFIVSKNILNGFIPLGWDYLAYHLNNTKYFLNNNIFNLDLGIVQIGYPLGLDVLNSLGLLTSDIRINSILYITFFIISVIKFLDTNKNFNLRFIVVLTLLATETFLKTPFMDFYTDILLAILMLNLINLFIEKRIGNNGILNIGIFLVLTVVASAKIYYSILLIPSLLIYMIIHKKKYILQFILFIFPLIIFFFRNTFLLGNPVHPYFNDLFKGYGYSLNYKNTRGDFVFVNILSQLNNLNFNTIIESNIFILNNFLLTISSLLLNFILLFKISKNNVIFYILVFNMILLFYFFITFGNSNFRYIIGLTIPVIYLAGIYVSNQALKKLIFIKLILISLLNFSTFIYNSAIEQKNIDTIFESKITNNYDQFDLIYYSVNRQWNNKTLLIGDSRLGLLPSNFRYADTVGGGILDFFIYSSSSKIYTFLKQNNFSSVVINNSWGEPALWDGTTWRNFFNDTSYCRKITVNQFIEVCDLRNH